MFTVFEDLTQTLFTKSKSYVVGVVKRSGVHMHIYIQMRDTFTRVLPLDSLSWTSEGWLSFKKVGVLPDQKSPLFTKFLPFLEPE